MEILSLIKKLISIPSYVDKVVNEIKIAQFIYDYLKQHADLSVKKNQVENGRFNVVAYSKNCSRNDGNLQADILFIDHIDTVHPRGVWQADQFSGNIKNGKMFGLGVCDTKANVAVLMKLAEKIKDERCMFLFYIDEEYDFKGMRSFIKTHKSKLKVRRIISADGEDLKIRNACRGLIELDIECFGKSGHSANPTNGADVIFNSYKALNKCKDYLKSLSDLSLGKPTLNVSYIRAGLYKGKESDVIKLGRDGNNIPDYLEATIEFRTNNQLKLSLLRKKLQRWFEKEDLQLKINKVRHNLDSWITDKRRLNFIIKAVSQSGTVVSFTDASKSGYVDITLLSNEFRCPCCCIGVRGGNRHAANEWVDIESIYKLEKILADQILIR